MKFRVQQLIEPLATAADSRVMEFDFEGLKLLEEGSHGQRAL